MVNEPSVFEPSKFYCTLIFYLFKCVEFVFLVCFYRPDLDTVSLSLSLSLLTESVPMNYISVVRTMFTCVEFVFPVCFNQPDPDKSLSLSLTASDLMNSISVIRIIFESQSVRQYMY